MTYLTLYEVERTLEVPQNSNLSKLVYIVKKPTEIIFDKFQPQRRGPGKLLHMSSQPQKLRISETETRKIIHCGISNV